MRKFLQDNELEVPDKEVSFEMLNSLLPQIELSKKEKAAEKLIVIQKLFDKIFDYKA